MAPALEGLAFWLEGGGIHTESPQEVRTLGVRGSGAQLLNQGSQVVKGRQSLEQQKG